MLAQREKPAEALKIIKKKGKGQGEHESVKI